ncbi:PAS domain-containing protein [Lysobacter humi (ex Lee et al. 2017)]
MRRSGEVDDRVGSGTLELARDRDRLRQIVDGLAELAALGLPGDMLMERIVARVREMTGATGAVVELLDGDELEYVAATGSIARHVGMRLARGTSLSGLCVSFRSLQYCDDTENDRRVDREACRRIGARSMLVVPLIHRDDAVGVVKVVSDRPGAFDEVHEYAVRLCAGLVAGIIARHLVAEESRRLLVERSFALQRATAILDAAPVPMLVHDLDGRVELWNAAAERLLGWRADEAIGRAVPFIAPERLPAFLAEARRCAADDGDVEGQLEWIGRRDGSRVEMRLSAVPLEDERGRVTSLVRSFDDAPQRLRAPRGGDARVRQLTAASRDAHIAMDADGRVLEWNPAAEALFGWTADEARGRLLAELVIPPAMRDAHHDGLNRYVASRRSGVVGRRLQLPALHRDGRPLRIEMTLSAAWVDGAPVFDALLQDAGTADPA